MNSLTTSNIFYSLRKELLESYPHLDNQITWESSLTADLHLDSTHLAALLAFARREIMDVDFGPWYVAASRDGGDSLGSLAAYLHDAVQRRAHAARAGEQ
jgi:hypothetical protein